MISYYDGSEVKIPLDPKYAPSKNAQIYCKKYGKAKTAVKEKKIQLGEVSQEIAYLESVLEFTEKAHSVEELRTIRQELTDSGFLRYRKNRNTKEKPSKPSPYAYTLTSGKRSLCRKKQQGKRLADAEKSLFYRHLVPYQGHPRLPRDPLHRRAGTIKRRAL